MSGWRMPQFARTSRTRCIIARVASSSHALCQIAGHREITRRPRDVVETLRGQVVGVQLQTGMARNPPRRHAQIVSSRGAPSWAHPSPPPLEILPSHLPAFALSLGTCPSLGFLLILPCIIRSNDCRSVSYIALAVPRPPAAGSGLSETNQTTKTNSCEMRSGRTWCASLGSGVFSLACRSLSRLLVVLCSALFASVAAALARYMVETRWRGVGSSALARLVKQGAHLLCSGSPRACTGRPCPSRGSCCSTPLASAQLATWLGLALPMREGEKRRGASCL